MKDPFKEEFLHATQGLGVSKQVLNDLFDALEENQIAIHELGLVSEEDFVEVYLEGRISSLDSTVVKRILRLYQEKREKFYV